MCQARAHRQPSKGTPYDPIPPPGYSGTTWSARHQTNFDGQCPQDLLVEGNPQSTQFRSMDMRRAPNGNVPGVSPNDDVDRRRWPDSYTEDSHAPSSAPTSTLVNPATPFGSRLSLQPYPATDAWHPLTADPLQRSIPSAGFDTQISNPDFQHSHYPVEFPESAPTPQLPIDGMHINPATSCVDRNSLYYSASEPFYPHSSMAMPHDIQPQTQEYFQQNLAFRSNYPSMAPDGKAP